MHGFVTKLFAESSPEGNGSPEHNRLRILMNLSKLAAVHPWPDILKLNEALFSGLEQGALTWDNWTGLAAWWEKAVEALRLRAATPKLPPPAPKRPAEGPAADTRQPKQPVDRRTDLFGIPGDFLRNAGICIKFNLDRCPSTTSPHDSPAVGSSDQVRHICGGCAFLKKPDDASHSMKSCKFKNSRSQSFQ